MLKPAAATAQTELAMVTLDQLVPRDHLLRLIDTHIRFDFIREKTEGLYCASNGRPAIDPVVLFTMLFIGYLFGVRSERRLVREIEVNVAYRWFLGLRLTDKVPDASTLSQNRRPSHREGYLHKREYAYDAQSDSYRCPAGQVIVYRGTNRMGYREYASAPSQCRQCPQRARCTQSQNAQKLITRHLWQHFKEQIDGNRLTELGKRLYGPRKETVERSFADAKELHGHRYARFRGQAKVQAQCLLSAACQNMKKIALLLARRAAALLSPRFRLYRALVGVLRGQHLLLSQTRPADRRCDSVSAVV